MAKNTGLAVVCPITSKVKGFHFEVKINQPKIKGAILPIHVRSLDVRQRHTVFAEKCDSRTYKKTLETIGIIIGNKNA